MWRSGDVFVYIPGEIENNSMLHYEDRLQDTPISYDSFQEQSKDE